MGSLYPRFLHRFLQFFFNHLYHGFAWTYDAVAWTVSLGNWRQWVSEAAEELPGPTVLELGHGPGHLQAMLAGKGIEMTGIDLSPQMGRIAAQRLRRLEIEIRLTRCRAQELPFGRDQFQQVIATFPTEYIFDLKTLAEAHRVLVPGGRLVVIPAAWITGKRWLERLAAWLFRVTGQALIPDSRMLQPFDQCGFNVQVKTIVKANWEVFMILAEKPVRQTRKN